jgi:hypothetical protein
MTKPVHWLTPKKKRDDERPDEFGITRKRVWRDGKYKYVYVNQYGREYSSAFESAIDGFTTPPETK